MVEQTADDGQIFYMNDTKAIQLLAISSQANVFIQKAYLELGHRREILVAQGDLILKNPFLSAETKEEEYTAICRQVSELGETEVVLPVELQFSMADFALPKTETLAQPGADTEHSDTDV